jgi:hypothetical protein
MKKSNFSGVPFYEFRNAPNMLKSELWRHVQKKHREQGLECGPEHAMQIAKAVVKQSNENLKWWRECKEGKDPADKYVKSIEQQIWVVCEGDYVRGYYTQARGSVAARHKDSYRSKLSHLRAAPREEFLVEIMAIIGCDRDKAESILETGRRNKFFKCCDRKLGIWRGVDAHEPRDLSTIRKSKPLTDKQRAKWEIFGEAPNLAYELERGRVKLNSEVIPWTIGRFKEVRGEDIDAEEAVIRLDDARRCSRIRELTPFETTGGRILGRNYYQQGTFRQMPQLHGRDVSKWIIGNSTTLLGCDPERLLAQAVRMEDVLTAPDNDPFAGEPTFIYIGVETLEVKRKAKQAAAEAKRATEEAENEHKRLEEERTKESLKRQEALRRLSESNPHLLRCYEALVNPDSEVSKTLRQMPLFADIHDAAQWLIDQRPRGLVVSSDPCYPRSLHTRQLDNVDEVVTLFFTAKDLGHVIWSEDFAGNHGRDWRPLSAAA